MRNWIARTALIAVTFALALPASGASADMSEGFDTVVPSGWSIYNTSTSVGLGQAWFQGTDSTSPFPGPFDAYDGAPNAYAAANFFATRFTGDTISAWLVTPQISTISNGDTLSLYTRKADQGTDFPDRLQVRISTNGACSPGTLTAGVGDFTTLLLDINPTLVANVYPKTWTQYVVPLSGLPVGRSTGCIAFRYFVTNGGPSAPNSDYIGIDAFRFTEDTTAPTAATVVAASPSSPSNVNTPLVRGSGAEAGASVSIHDNAACTGTPLGTSSGAVFDDTGVPVTVPSDATTTLWAQVTDGDGNASPCSSTSVSYTEDSTPPAAPALTATSPTSPSSDATPTVTGTAAANTTVAIYDNAACTGAPLGSGTAAALGSPGVEVTVPANAVTTLYAAATDAVGNTSACSTPAVSYRHDAIAPQTSDDVDTDTDWASAPVVVTLTAADASGSGVAHTYYEIGAAPTTPTASSPEYDPSDRPSLADGDRIVYFSVDAAGNAETPQTSGAAKVDTDGPVTTDDVPTAEVDGPVAVTLTATDGAGSGVAATYYETGAAPATPTPTSTRYDPAAKPVLRDGERIAFLSVDEVGNAEAPHVSGALRVKAVVEQPQLRPQPDPLPEPQPQPLPPPVPPAAPPAAPPRVVTALTSDVSCIGTGPRARKDITVRYTTAQAATTTFTLQRRTSPTTARHTRCPATLPTGDGATTKGGEPLVYVTATGSAGRATARVATAGAARSVRQLVLTRTERAGTHTLRLLRALKTTNLKPGRYRLRVASVTSDGAHAPARSLYLWVLTRPVHPEARTSGHQTR